MRVIGVDLGQAADYTAISLIETKPGPLFDLSFLERPELKTSYPKIVRRLVQVVAAVAEFEPKDDLEMVVDATGVGRPVIDMMREAGLSPIPVQITGGAVESYGDWSYMVPKRALISNAQVVFQRRLLHVAKTISLGPVFIKELESFKVKIDPVTAHDSYAAGREGQHDDIVLSVALALWRAMKHAEMPEKEKPKPGSAAYNKELEQYMWDGIGRNIEQSIAARDGLETWD